MELFDKSFDNFLDKENEKVLLVKGDWGAGKTYSIMRGLDRNKSQYKFITVSLFGLQSLDDLSVAFSNEVLKGLLLKNGVHVLNFLTAIPYVSKFIPRKIPSLEKIQIKNFSKELVVFFDDIERTSINIKDFLGYIEQMKSSSLYKVVLALNEDKLSDSDSEAVFSRMREKVVDKEIKVFNAVDSFISEKYPEESGFLIDFFSRVEVGNLRVIRKAVDVMSFFCGHISLLNDDNMKRLKLSCLFLSVEFYMEIDDLRTVYGFDRNFLFNPLISMYLDSQILDLNIIKNKELAIVEVQEKEGNNKQVEEIVCLFEDSFKCNEGDIIQKSKSFLTKAGYKEEYQVSYVFNLLHKLKVPIDDNIVHGIFNKDTNYTNGFVENILTILGSGELYDYVSKMYYLPPQQQQQQDCDDEGAIDSILLSNFNLNIYKQELMVYSCNDWVKFIENDKLNFLFKYKKNEIIEYISSKEGDNLRAALSLLMSSNLQSERLKIRFGNDIDDLLKVKGV
ncbi:hypothetical protein [Photobacterium leiognathi]|uniref:hypothetical protein n=1 Tax=Photobacterium leiognathi TaxID=553611 RepID=UPI002981A64B|nr:hypothetical protein [Photobacterium leiognathi]